MQLSNILEHYDPIRLAADASAYGVGAVISHIMEDAFTSWTLTPTRHSHWYSECVSSSTVDLLH